MPTSIIEVIDTGVKIGLGSLITLVGTYFVTKINHKHEHDKESRKRFYDSLEVVGANVEEITHIVLRYWALIIEWARNNEQGMGLTSKRQEELEKTKNDLFHQFKNLTVAESKLLLLNLSTQSKLVREYGEFITELRRKYYEGKSGLTEEEMKSVRLALLQKREKLFESLAEAYANGL